MDEIKLAFGWIFLVRTRSGSSSSSSSFWSSLTSVSKTWNSISLKEIKNTKKPQVISIDLNTGSYTCLLLDELSGHAKRINAIK